MNTNFSQAQSWIKSAISDMKIVINSLQNEFFSLVAFRSQFAVEKLNKAIINFMGLKSEKTHTPTDILEEILKNKSSFTIDQKTKKILYEILKHSKFFEIEGVQTRYGAIKDNKLIIAEEIYQSFEDIEPFLVNLQNILINYLDLLTKSLNMTKEKHKDLEQLELILGELKGWT